MVALPKFGTPSFFDGHKRKPAYTAGQLSGVLGQTPEWIHPEREEGE